jgi:hypothetical protein
MNLMKIVKKDLIIDMSKVTHIDIDRIYFDSGASLILSQHDLKYDELANQFSIYLDERDGANLNRENLESILLDIAFKNKEEIEELIGYLNKTYEM